MIGGKIPVVDLVDFFSEEKKHSFVKEVGTALEEIGFFAVKNHSITENILKNIYSVSTAFFNLSSKVKSEYERPDILRQRGYTSFGQEHAKGSNAPDLKEFYMIASETIRDSPFGPNIWPKEIPELKDSSVAMFNHLEDLSNILLQCCALYIDENVNRNR